MPKTDQRGQDGILKKHKIRGVIEYLDAKKIPYFKSDVFDHFGVSHRQGWAMISEASEDQRHLTSDGLEHRGRPSKISIHQLREMERIVKEEGFEARQLTWQELAWEAGIEGVSTRTISKAMGNTMNYHNCTSCKKAWVNASTARERLAHAEAFLQYRPTPTDWHIVRFSDEVHWAIGPEGAKYITRKPGERYCSDCTQQKEEKGREKETRKIHAWAAVGYNFKSDLAFYQVQNGKLSMQTYINNILEPVVKTWINKGYSFVLEEDNDPSHGTGKTNPVRTWKENNGLKYYFNCHGSPDLSIIGDCWQLPKQYAKKFPYWDEGKETTTLAREAWSLINQDFINDSVESMPERLKNCIDMEGHMPDY